MRLEKCDISPLRPIEQFGFINNLKENIKSKYTEKKRKKIDAQWKMNRHVGDKQKTGQFFLFIIFIDCEITWQQFFLRFVLLCCR